MSAASLMPKRCRRSIEASLPKSLEPPALA
jgi:hypothetical protein